MGSAPRVLAARGAADCENMKARREGLARLLKRTLRRFAMRRGYYIGRSSGPDAPATLSAHLSFLFSVLQINCVLDVGAHNGEFSDAVRDLGYGGRIVSFEPVPEHFAELSRRRAHDPDWRGYPLALGADDGRDEIQITNSSSFASMHLASAYGRDRFARDVQVVRREPVSVRRLDGLLDECVAGIVVPRVFLKIDTQGEDMAVIAGAGDRLHDIRAVQVELAVQAIYENTTNSYLESIAQLGRLGFEPTFVAPVSRDPVDHLRIVELDCVFWQHPPT
jgi:FkbM family methyltransferase